MYIENYKTLGKKLRNKSSLAWAKQSLLKYNTKGHRQEKKYGLEE
jgi:hypothetical protein